MNIRPCYLCGAFRDSENEEHIEWHERLREALLKVSDDKTQGASDSAPSDLVEAAKDALFELIYLAEVVDGHRHDDTTKGARKAIHNLDRALAVRASESRFNADGSLKRCEARDEAGYRCEDVVGHEDDHSFEDHTTEDGYELPPSDPGKTADAQMPGANPVWCGRAFRHPPHITVPGSAWCAGEPTAAHVESGADHGHDAAERHSNRIEREWRESEKDALAKGTEATPTRKDGAEAPSGAEVAASSVPASPPDASDEPHYVAKERPRKAPDTGYPTRSDIRWWSAAEKAIQAAVDETGSFGADIRLTKAVGLLADARAWVADFMEDVPPKDHPRPAASAETALAAVSRFLDSGELVRVGYYCDEQQLYYHDVPPHPGVMCCRVLVSRPADGTGAGA